MLSDWERKKWLTLSSSLACCLSFCSRLMSNHNSSCTAELLNLGELSAMTPYPRVQGRCGLQKSPVMWMFWAIGAAKGTSIPGERSLKWHFAHHERGKRNNRIPVASIVWVPEGEYQGHIKALSATDGEKHPFPLILPEGQHQSIPYHVLHEASLFIPLFFCVTNQFPALVMLLDASLMFQLSSLSMSCFSLYYSIF